MACSTMVVRYFSKKGRISGGSSVDRALGDELVAGEAPGARRGAGRARATARARAARRRAMPLRIAALDIHNQRCLVVSPRLGAHLSIAGGLPRAVDRAEASGCEALQIFTKSAGQWRARELPPEEIALFRRRVRQTGIRPVIAHNSYLINLAAADPRAAAQVDRRARAKNSIAPRRSVSTGWSCIPGSYTTGTEHGGLRLIADGTRGGARRRVPTDARAPARAHRRPGHEPRPPLRASRRDHRRCSAARRASASASTPATC